MTDGMTRRTMLGTMGLGAMGTTLALPIAAGAAAAKAGTAGRMPALLAGTYAREGGKGLYPITGAADRWQIGTPVGDIVDASFGIGGGPGGSWYLVREQAQGELSVYAAGWARRATVSTGGADPCHLALDQGSACLAVANYSSGSVAFYQLDRRTGLPTPAGVFRHADVEIGAQTDSGRGRNHDRQEAPHAHWVGFSPDRRWLHAVDLGADAIFAYRFDPRARTVAAPLVAWQAPAGAGPRHMARHPRLALAYVVCELSNALYTLDARTDGRFVTRYSISTLPKGHAGASQAAHIAIDRAGRRMYVSNRGHDSIAVFALDAAGTPTLLQHSPSGGHWPRVFVLLDDERRLVVGNERSGTLAVFRVAGDGRLTPTGETRSVPGIVFLGRPA
ncbi:MULTISPECIES: lactonase family protein [Sphingomonas]|uniref:lactonase family protein n=1 Tax=Sphingomonas TaxID=13687 RepID=UPI0020BF0CEE|nr:lactonase family protein [Sphingomonas faeni]MCK8457088.1 lactonase family protein [Sphingomonas faeni]